MPDLVIKIYRQDGSAGNNARVLIKRIEIENTSAKKLTGNQAKKILAKDCPEFVTPIKTDEGWQASRCLKPTEKCGYHYIWEYAVISEEI